jgi:CheY-like chemotaxis protein
MPIVALSANVMAEVIEKCVAAGFNSYITKPVDFQMLSSEIIKLLDRDDPTKPLETMRAKA